MALRQSGTAVEALIPPFAGVSNAEGRGVSSTGLIVGTMDISGAGQRGFIYDHGTGQWTQLDPLPGGTFCAALGVNDNDQVVGFWGNHITGPSPLGFLHENGRMVDLMALLDTPRARPAVINNAGLLTGWKGSSPNTDARAFILDMTSGELTTLPPVPGGTTSDGRAITENGLVAGFGWVDFNPPTTFIRHAFLWDGEMTDLGVLPGYVESFGLGANESGSVVGYCFATGQQNRAFIWRDGEIQPIDQLGV